MELLDDVDRSVTAELPDAALIEIFRQWPSSSTVERLYDDAGDDWPPLSGELTEALSTGPTDASCSTSTPLVTRGGPGSRQTH